MKAYLIAILLAGLVSLLLTGCGITASSKSSKAKIPWTRVKQVETTSDTEAGQAEASLGNGLINPGASQSQVILSWGVPEYILGSPADPEHNVWQYSHTVVVFQGTKVQQVLAR